jgi:hypothetical protein
LIDIFRSSFLVLPLLFLVMEISVLIREFTAQKTITLRSLSHILKSLLLLTFGGFFLRLIAMLPGVGLSSAAAGAIALFISSSEPMLKSLSPLIAPNISKLSVLLDEIDFLDGQFMNSIRSNREKEQSQSRSRVNREKEQSQSRSRVNEIRREEEEDGE